MQRPPAPDFNVAPTPRAQPAAVMPSGQSAWEARLRAPPPPPARRRVIPMDPVRFVPPLPLSEPCPRDDQMWPLQPHKPIEAPLSLRKALANEEVELWQQRLAWPLTILLAWFVHFLPGGAFVQRLTMGMMVHELGHAVTAWTCGFVAIPMPWVTWIRDERSWGWTILLSVVLGGGGGWLIRQGWLTQGGALLGVLAVHWLGSLILPLETAQALITFGGDGAGLLLAAVLVTQFSLGPRWPWTRGGLRWGWLVIGCVAWIDLSAAWWAALSDPTAIPYGMIHGVGLSDASKLTERHGWLQSALVHRYVAVSLTAFGIMAASWVRGMRQAAAAVKARDPD